MLYRCVVCSGNAVVAYCPYIQDDNEHANPVFQALEIARQPGVEFGKIQQSFIV